MKKNWKLTAYIVLTAIFILLALNPINSKMFNLLIAADMAAIWVLSLYLSRKKKAVFISLLVLPILFIALLFIDGKKVPEEEIRDEYVKSLLSYDGVRYIWGGESRFGLDCSGLVRRGLVDAYLKVGFSHVSPQYIRKAMYLWFNDCSARGLKEGVKNYTILLMNDQILNKIEYSRIKPGDVMVTATGQHTMVYVGGRNWIQADPEFGYVLIKPTPDKDYYYYKTKVVIVRWKELALKDI